MSLLKPQSLIGRTVVSHQGRELGTVYQLFVDTERWHIPSLKIKLRRDALGPLRLKRPWLGTQIVTISTDQVSGVEDMVVLGKSVEDLIFCDGEPDKKVEKPRDGAAEKRPAEKPEEQRAAKQPAETADKAAG